MVPNLKEMGGFFKNLHGTAIKIHSYSEAFVPSLCVFQKQLFFKLLSPLSERGALYKSIGHLFCTKTPTLPQPTVPNTTPVGLIDLRSRVPSRYPLPTAADRFCGRVFPRSSEWIGKSIYHEDTGTPR